MAAPLNGATKWIAIGFSIVLTFCTVVVWGIRQEGEIKLNRENAKHQHEEITEMKDDMAIIKEDVKKILEKM